MQFQASDAIPGRAGADGQTGATVLLPGQYLAAFQPSHQAVRREQAATG